MNQSFESPAIHMGIPSVGSHLSDLALDLNELMVKNPTSTFFMKIQGSNLIRYGIFEGDILIVDKSIISKKGLGVFEAEGSFIVNSMAAPKKDSIFWGKVTGIVRKTD